MPPIRILGTELAPDGTLLVAFRDEANLDGLPLEGFYRLDPENLRELAAVEELVGSPMAEWFRSAAAVLDPDDETAPTVRPKVKRDGQPDARTAPVVEGFRAAYEQAISDRCDRHRYGIKSSAPHRELDEHRRGVAAGRTRRRLRADPELADFAKRHRLARRAQEAAE